MKDYVTGLSGIALAGYLYTVTQSFAAAGGGLAKNPAYYPNMLLAIVAVLSLWLIIAALDRREQPGFRFNKTLITNVTVIFGMIFVYILALQYLGFIVSTAAFVIVGVLVYGGSLKTAVLTGIPVTAGVYLVFHVLLKVVMPKGLLI